MNKRILKTILLGLAAYFALLVTPIGASAAELSDKTLSNFHQYLFQIPYDRQPEEWLRDYIKILEAEIESDPDNIQRVHLFAGDAYHWLGHVLEEKGRLPEAFEAHKTSKDHYKKSFALYSPLVNFLWPEGHANKHLDQLAHKLYLPANPAWKHGWGEYVVRDNEDQIFEDYRAEFREIIKRHESTASGCDALLSSSLLKEGF